MKKIKLITFGLIIGFLLGMSVFTFATDQQLIKLVVNGKDIISDVSPQNINGRVMVPARALAEALGAKVQWDAENNTVVVTSEVKVIESPIKQEPIKIQPIVQNPVVEKPVVEKPVVEKPISKPIDNTKQITNTNTNTNQTTEDGFKIQQKNGYSFYIKDCYPFITTDDGIEYYAISWIDEQTRNDYSFRFNLEKEIIDVIFNDHPYHATTNDKVILENIPYKVFEGRSCISKNDYENKILPLVNKGE